MTLHRRLTRLEARRTPVLPARQHEQRGFTPDEQDEFLRLFHHYTADIPIDELSAMMDEYVKPLPSRPATEGHRSVFDSKRTV